MSNDLLKQIDDLVASKTFNLDALDGIKKLKDNLSQTLEERDVLKRRHADLAEINSRQSDQLQQQIKQIEKLTKDLEASEAYRAKACESIYEAEKHKAVADAYKDALYTVFKPNAVRENIHHTMPVMVTSNGNSYPQTVQHQQTITREDA